ncbi:hypothetical protein DD607_28525 [Salmonella sp. 3DZ2-4SM]|nr:hypothetical protein DD607_28525 [Salmonella sp. 3DZ2-4SM]
MESNIGSDSGADDNLIDVSTLQEAPGLDVNNNEYRQDLRNINSITNNKVTTSVTNNVSENQVSDKENKDNNLPDTGEVKTNSGTLLATLLAGLGSIFLFSRRRNNKKE